MYPPPHMTHVSSSSYDTFKWFPIAQTVNGSIDCVALFNGSILTTSWVGSSSSYKVKNDIEE
jgi:hypothetical protein